MWLLVETLFLSLIRLVVTETSNLNNQELNKNNLEVLLKIHAIALEIRDIFSYFYMLALLLLLLKLSNACHYVVMNYHLVMDMWDAKVELDKCTIFLFIYCASFVLLHFLILYYMVDVCVGLRLEVIYF